MSSRINKMAGYLLASFCSFFSSSFHFLIEFLELYLNNIMCKTWSSDMWQDCLSFLTYLKVDVIICEWPTFIDATGDRETEFVLWFWIYETSDLGTSYMKLSWPFTGPWWYFVSLSLRLNDKLWFFWQQVEGPSEWRPEWPFRYIQQDVRRVNENILDISVRRTLSADCLYADCFPINALRVVAWRNPNRCYICISVFLIFFLSLHFNLSSFTLFWYYKLYLSQFHITVKSRYSRQDKVGWEQ
jgi:hypothetical protein